MDLKNWAEKKAVGRRPRPPKTMVARSGVESLAPEDRAQLSAWGKAREVEGNPPAWVASEAIWEKAKKAVEPRWDEYDEPYAAVASVYFQMGGEKK